MAKYLSEIAFRQIEFSLALSNVRMQQNALMSSGAAGAPAVTASMATLTKYISDFEKVSDLLSQYKTMTGKTAQALSSVSTTIVAADNEIAHSFGSQTPNPKP